MDQENKNITKPLWWWLTLILLIFITVSPFLVTVLEFRLISIVRELLVITLFFVGLKQRKKTSTPIVKDDIERLIAWLLALGLLSTIFITQDLGAFVWSARYSLLPLTVFWSLHSFNTEEEQIKTLITYWLYWSAGVIVFGLIMVGVIPKETLIEWGYNPAVAVGDGQWLAAATIPAYQTVAGSIPRLQSTMSGPIQFAGFSLIVVFLAPFIKQTTKHFLYPTLALIGVIGVLGSFSRAAWIALFLGGVYLLYNYFLNKGWKKGEIFAIFFIFTTIIVLTSSVVLFRPNAERQRQLIADIFNRSVSDREHVNSISQSLQDYQEIGLFGLGFGYSGAASIQNKNINILAPEPRFVDNSYIRWYEELGILGAVVFINLLYFLTKELFKQSSSSKRLALAFIALSVTALFTDMWLEAVPAITVFALAGLVHKSPTPKLHKTEIKVGKFKLFNKTHHDFVNKIMTLQTEQKTNHIVTLNPEMMVESFKNEALTNVLIEADHVTADGVGILAAAQYQALNKQNNKLTYWLFAPFYWVYTFYQLLFTPDKLQPHLFRITGSDLAKSILEEGNQRRIKLAVLGSTEDILKNIKKNLHKNYQNIRLVFADTGPEQVRMNGEVAEHEIRKLSSTLNHLRPDILLVALGVPKQELFLHRYKQHLKIPVLIGISGAFDMVLANSVKRAPKLFRVMQLEWLWRLLIQPSRIKRIFTATITFPYLHSKFLAKR